MVAKVFYTRYTSSRLVRGYRKVTIHLTVKNAVLGLIGSLLTVVAVASSPTGSSMGRRSMSCGLSVGLATSRLRSAVCYPRGRAHYSTGAGRVQPAVSQPVAVPRPGQRVFVRSVRHWYAQCAQPRRQSEAVPNGRATVVTL